MRKLVFLCMFCIAMGNTNAQEKTVQSESNKKEFKSNAEITTGFVLSDEFLAFKTTVGANNILFKQLGAYTTIELGIADRPNFNIWGITTSITPKLYIFGGVDFFTNQGWIKNEFPKIRKEIGIGYAVFDWGIIRAGWSFTLGPTATIGINLKI